MFYQCKKIAKDKWLIVKIICAIMIGCLLMCVSEVAKAADESDYIMQTQKKGDLYWNIDANGHFKIWGNGDYDIEHDYNNPIWGMKAEYRSKILTAEVNVTGITSCYQMFYGCTSLTKIDFVNFDTSNVTTMQDMFYNCKNLETLNLKGFDTRKVKTMENMFWECEKLDSLDLGNFDTSNTTNMRCMFFACKKLKYLNVSSFDTSKVTRMGLMFARCSSLQKLDVSGFDTGNVTEMTSMFAICYKLDSIDVTNFNTENVSDMASMFSGCDILETIDLSSFDTSEVTDFSHFFSGCSNLQSLDLRSFDTTSLKNAKNAFDGCDNLKEVQFPDDCSQLLLDAWKNRQVSTKPSNPDPDPEPTPDPDPVIPEGFDLKKDGYSFCNSYEGFGYRSGDRIALQRYQEVFGNAYTSQIYNQYADRWGGSCFGMSASADLFYKNRLNKAAILGMGRTINSGGSTVNGYRVVFPDNELRKVIERYQIWLDSSERDRIFSDSIRHYGVDSDCEKNKEVFKEILEKIKKEHETYVICVYWSRYGHAMLTDSFRQPQDMGNGWERIFLYDPNCPYYNGGVAKQSDDSEKRYMDVNMQTGEWRLDAMTNSNSSQTGKTGFDENGAYYSGTDAFFMETTEVPADFNTKATLSSWKGGETLSYSSDSFSVYDNSQTLLYSKENGEVTYCSSAVLDIPYIGVTKENDSVKSRGKLQMIEGIYTVHFRDGTIAFLANGDYAGVKADGDVTITGFEDLSIRLNANQTETVNVVIEDCKNKASDHSGEEIFTCVGTDLKVDDSDCNISFKDGQLIVDTEDEQTVDIHVETENADREIKNLPTSDLENGYKIADKKTAFPEQGKEKSKKNTVTSSSKKAKQTISIKKTRYKMNSQQLKKKAKKISLKPVFNNGNMHGTVSYKLTKYPKRGKKSIKVDRNGNITIKKKAPKGTYKIQITVSGTPTLKKAAKTVTIVVK